MTNTKPAENRLEQRFDGLVELTRALAGMPPLREALQLVTDASISLLAADHVSIRLLDDRKDLVSWARSGVVIAEPASVNVEGEGAAAWACREERSALVDDVSKEERFDCAAQGLNTGSLLSVPMWSFGKVSGVFTAGRLAVSPFDGSDEELAQVLSNCVAPMIYRLQLERRFVAPKLEHALASPLRLRLISELFEHDPERGLSVDEAVVRSGRHRQDVIACLEPLVSWGILDKLEEDGRYRLRSDLSSELQRTIKNILDDQSDELGRERHIRHHLLGGMIGLDPKMQVIFESVRQVARIDVPVLITGETGTGKELVARAIHDTSPRRKGFFGAVNCATLTESLFESQVFGHARGAFTGAVQAFSGLIERCHDGTLFLDEVGDLTLPNQVKLLRLLQEGTFTRLGETTPRRSDFRLISATNQDLSAMVASGSFREDLYYRLAVFPIRIPSLRERLGDLRYLAEGILAVQAQRYRSPGCPPVITDEALSQLRKYHWPGNVRELENVLARAAVMAGDTPISPEHLLEVELLSERPRESQPPTDSTDDLMRTLDEVEREHIIKVLRSQRGNIKASAQILDISRTTLYKKIRDYEIDAPT